MLVERAAGGAVAREVGVGGARGRGRPQRARGGREGAAAGLAGLEGLAGLVRRRLLPTGYPGSVSDDYSEWLAWHASSVFLRDVLQVVSAQSLLVGLGLGAAPAASPGAVAVAAGPVAAATQWVLKDGAGSLGTLAVGSLGGQRFDDDPKRWWVVCSFAEDCALAVQLLAPLYPALFLPIAAASAALRSGALVGRQSLVNGVMMQHFGRAENFGDVRAKLEALGRLLALAALPAGIGAFRWAAVSGGFLVEGGEASGGSAAVSLLLYAGVFLGHNYCCFRAAQALQFRSLNRTRLCLVAAAYAQTGKVPLPAEVAGQEGVFKPRGGLRTSLLGVGIEQSGVRGPQLAAAAESLALQGFFVTPRGVLLSSEADAEAVLEAALASERFRWEQGRSPRAEGPLPTAAAADGAMNGVRRWASEHRTPFVRALRQAGWKVSFVPGPCPRVDVERGAPVA